MTQPHYTLWLVPSTTAASTLKKIIGDLARHYDTPAFEPHVTLLGGINGVTDGLLSNLSALSESIGDLRLSIESIECGNDYFQSVVGIISHDNRLEAIRERAGSMTGSAPAIYNPHLSLIYGDLAMSTKVEIQAALQLELPLPFPLEIGAIELQNTTGEVADWSLQQAFPTTELNAR